MMRPCIYFKQKPANDPFEGARLRKTLKGALELEGIAYVDSLHASSDFLHVLSPESEDEALEEKKDGKKIVVSAFYTEDDPNCSFLTKDSEGLIQHKLRGQKLLSAADLILVPNKECIDLLETFGIKGEHIRVLTPGVNLARFEKGDPLEETLFRTYFRFDAEKYLLSIVDLRNKMVQKFLENLAKSLPNYKIFCLGTDGKGKPSPSFLKRLSKQAPKNLVYSGIVDDDIYRSGMIGASGYLSFGPYHFDILSVLEAHAANVPVFGVGSAPDEASIVVDDPIAFASSLASVPQGIMIEGYRLAKASALSELGPKLRAMYEQLLKK